MDELKPTGRKLGRVFNSRPGPACTCHDVALITKTAELNVENSAQTTFGFSLVGFRPTWKMGLPIYILGFAYFRYRRYLVMRYPAHTLASPACPSLS